MAFQIGLLFDLPSTIFENRILTFILIFVFNQQSECSGQKPCKGDKYCDPLDGTCKDKAGVGERCFMKDQCKKDNGVICIWGRCSPGKLGQAGRTIIQP